VSWFVPSSTQDGLSSLFAQKVLAVLLSDPVLSSSTLVSRIEQVHE